MTNRRHHNTRATTSEHAGELSLKAQTRAPVLSRPSDPYGKLLDIIATEQSTIGPPRYANPVHAREPGTVLATPTWSPLTDPDLLTSAAGATAGCVPSTPGKVLPTPTWSPLTDPELQTPAPASVGLVPDTQARGLSTPAGSRLAVPTSPTLATAPAGTPCPLVMKP